MAITSSLLRLQMPVLRAWCVVGCMIMAGFVIRCLLIPKFYMGPDEAWNVLMAHQPSVREVMASVFAEDVHPPLYCILLHALLQVSDNLFLLRFLSVLPWILWVIVCYCIGIELGGKRQARIWAALAAFSFVSLIDSLDIRDYMWMLLLLTGQFYCFLKLYKQPSHTVVAMYFVCGMVAIAFDYSAAMAICAMGIILGLQMCKTVAQHKRLTAEIVLLHMVQAGFLYLIYSQHAFYQPGAIKAENNYFQHSSSIMLILLFIQKVTMAVLPGTAWENGLILLLLLALQPFWCQRPVMAVLLGLNMVLMLVFNYFNLYPAQAGLRHMTWMLPAIMAWLAFSIDYALGLLSTKIRGVVASAALVVMAWNSAAGFSIDTASTPSEFKTFIDATAAIGEHDLVFIDIQTKMLMQYQHQWKWLAHYPHVDEARWDGHDVFYPGAKGVLSIILDQPSLTYFSQTVHEHMHDRATPSIWIVDHGFAPNINKECSDALSHSSTLVLRQETGFISQFTPQAFLDFVAHCLPKPAN